MPSSELQNLVWEMEYPQMEYLLVVERAGVVGVSVQRWWLLRGSVVQRWNCGLYRDDFLSTSHGYKELRIS